MNDLSAADDVDALTATAQGFFQNKDFIEALDAFEVLCRLRPDNAHFADRYAACHSALNRLSDAKAAWVKVILKHGKSIGRVNALARAHIDLHDYAAAEKLLASSRDDVKANANFFVFSTIASLGVGDMSHALDNSQHVEKLADEESVPAVNYLCGHLDRLGREGYAENVLHLIDLLLPSIVKRRRVVQTGISMAALLGRSAIRLSYAREMIKLEPNDSEGYVQQIRALLDVGRIDECRQLIVEVNARFPKSGRSLDDAKIIGDVEDRLASCTIWRKRLSQAGDSLAFRDLNFRIAALMSLNQHDKAIEVAATGTKVFNEHPWFMTLLGRCHQQIGDLDSALYWCGKATERDASCTNYLLHLGWLQLQCGLRDEALRTAQTLIRKHPNLAAVKSLLNKLGQVQNVLDDARTTLGDRAIQPHGTWLHGGDSGDLIYALASMQARGGGHLYLTCIDGTREPMDESMVEFLTPLLTAQHYIEGVGTWQGEFIANDFTLVRHLMFPDVDLATQQWRCVSRDEDLDVKVSWLTVPPTVKHGRPVFARSKRYRNHYWDVFWKELKASSPDALFVGTDDEFDDFAHGEHYFARNALDLAEVISGASVFVGNQSLPYAIAEGLKVGRLLEVSSQVPNCTFPGALGLLFNIGRKC